MLWRCQFVGYSDLMFGWNSKLDTSFVIRFFLKRMALFEKHNLDVIEHRFCFWLTGYFVFVWALCSTQMHTFDNEKYSKRFKLYKNRVEQVQSSTRRKKSFIDFKRFYEVFFSDLWDSCFEIFNGIPKWPIETLNFHHFKRAKYIQVYEDQKWLTKPIYLNCNYSKNWTLIACYE